MKACVIREVRALPPHTIRLEVQPGETAFLLDADAAGLLVNYLEEAAAHYAEAIAADESHPADDWREYRAALQAHHDRAHFWSNALAP